MNENTVFRGSAEHRITDIHCPECGAPAAFDILQQKYLCSYCGGKVEIREAQEQKQGFRKIQTDKLNHSVKKYRLFRASCSGCGAKVVFEEGEAISNCAFCGRSLVRTEYLDAKDMPESVIPFRLTEEEARDRLAEWCRANSHRREAKKLRSRLPDLLGFYLPYELVRGPVHMRAERMDGGRKYPCEGFLKESFVNRSKQLDNLLLDGMEPFDTEELTEFDFAYVAGHRVKISDISDKMLEDRTDREAAETYTPTVRKVLETKAVEIDADVSSAVRLPVLLPVYYICDGELMAAVNGQTGKVSVRAEKESHYYFLPWWLKAFLSAVIFSGVFYAVLRLAGMAAMEDLMITGMLAAVYLIITLCLYSDTTRNRFSVESGRKIFTSGEKSFRRERGRLVQSDAILKCRVEEPVFFQSVEGKVQPVVLKFTSPARVLKMLLLCFGALFLPVIVALFVNGFRFSMLNLGGSAVWFCIMVPVVPIYLLKFGRVELYENPWVYTLSEDGKKKRYRKKHEIRITKSLVFGILRAVFIPPVSLAVWFGILSFCTMVYLTAGFE